MALHISLLTHAFVFSGFLYAIGHVRPERGSWGNKWTCCMDSTRDRYHADSPNQSGGQWHKDMFCF
jgi:hypothetical protein